MLIDDHTNLADLGGRPPVPVGRSFSAAGRSRRLLNTVVRCPFQIAAFFLFLFFSPMLPMRSTVSHAVI
jgi:hypothetical protein